MPSGHGHREGGGGVLTASWYQVEIAGQNQSPIILIVAAESYDTGWLLLLPDSYIWRARSCADEDCIQAGPWPEALQPEGLPFTYEDAAPPTPQSPQAPGGIHSGYTITRRGTYFLAGQAVAIRQVIPGESNNLLHLHTDHLGSNSVMSYNNGGGMVGGSRTRYLPFGAYRTAPTQTYTDRGYTGQKHNDDLGLIYYNARYYIAGIARFASADTIVPDATNPQAFNRYTYVLNSPFTLIDPSGHRPSDGCDYEGCSLLNGFDSDSTWQAPDGTQTPWDPVVASDQDYNPITEAVIPGIAGLLGVAALPTALGYFAGEVAWPVLVRGGQTIASLFCLNDGDCTNEVSTASRTLGQLRQVSRNMWESTAGLRYGDDRLYGNRVLHVLRHLVDDSGRRIHGVFSGGRLQVLPLIDEAWASIQQGVNVASSVQVGTRTIYIVDIGRPIGYVGGQVGAAAGYPITNYIRLVIEGGNELVTAYPAIP